MNVAELLQAQTQVCGEVPALISGSGRRTRVMTFAALDKASGRLAACLHQRGLEKGDTALLLQPMSIELYVVLLALCRLGAMAMFLDPSARRSHLAACCALIPPKALIASPKAHLLRAAHRELRRIPIKLSTAGGMPGAQGIGSMRRHTPLRHFEPCSPKDPALITFTSGTSGKPKGVARSHGLLAAQHAVLNRTMRHRGGMVDLVTLPIFILSSLAAGISCVIPDANLREPRTADPAPLLRQIAEHGVTRVVASPALCERLLEDTGPYRAALRGIRDFHIGGGPVFLDLMRRLASAAPHARVTALYGSTEAEPIAHVTLSEISSADVAATGTGMGIPAGRVVPEVRLAVLPDHSGHPIGPFTARAFAARRLPAGQIGEVVVAGPHVLTSYLDGDGAGKIKFKVGNDTWHRTGDAGYLDDSGRLWLMGRCDAKIVDGSDIFYPLSLEAAARARLGPRRVACANSGGKRMLVIESDGRDLNDEALRADLAWARIDAVRVVKRIPTDKRHNSKVDYAVLNKMLGDGEMSERSSAAKRARAANFADVQVPDLL